LSSKTHRADPLELYRWAVQDPETHAALLDVIHARMSPDRITCPSPRVLREDFAGTAAESVAWLARAAGRRAYAIDLNAATLDWAAARARRMLGRGADSLTCLQADVLTLTPEHMPPADIISALNFSIMYFAEHQNLLRYLQAARLGLASGGILVCNLFGGRANERPGITTHTVKPTPKSPGDRPIEVFEYRWEIRTVEAATRVADCRIHFRLPGPGGRAGRFIPDAFRYAFKLWEPTEITATCLQAGFARAEVWRHTYDPAKGASGVFLGPTDPAGFRDAESWTAYIVAAA